MPADANTLIFSPVDDFSSFTGFSCGDADLDDFIQREAVRYRKLSIMLTYAAYLPDDTSRKFPLSFASLLCSSIALSGAAQKATKISNLDFPFLPVVKLERFGVRFDLKDQGIGRFTMENVLSMLKEKQILGYRLLIVDAYRTAKDFYKKMGFDYLPPVSAVTTTVPMFLDLARWGFDT